MKDTNHAVHTVKIQCTENKGLILTMRNSYGPYWGEKGNFRMRLHDDMINGLGTLISIPKITDKIDYNWPIFTREALLDPQEAVVDYPQFFSEKLYMGYIDIDNKIVNLSVDITFKSMIPAFQNLNSVTYTFMLPQCKGEFKEFLHNTPELLTPYRMRSFVAYDGKELPPKSQIIFFKRPCLFLNIRKTIKINQKYKLIFNKEVLRSFLCGPGVKFICLKAVYDGGVRYFRYNGKYNFSMPEDDTEILKKSTVYIKSLFNKNKKCEED